LLPHFGHTEQVGFVYFVKKQVVNVFGIIEAVTNNARCYITDKQQAGSKNANQELNFLLQYGEL
jgi:hypothetical protein